MLIGKTNDEKIWNYLKSKGFSDCGAAGTMANTQSESGNNPQNLQNTYEKKLGFTDATYTAAVDSGSYDNFVRDRAGYGLCQWTFWSRKQNLLRFAQAQKKSIGDLEMQLDFLLKELSEGYSSLLDKLRSASSVKEASDAFMLQFERPADQSEAAKNRRASCGQQFYEKFAAKMNGGGNLMAKKITTGKELAAAALNVAQNYKTLYVMGCFGAPMTAANKKRYIDHHSYNRGAERTAMIRAASADTFGFDCVCLIKGLLWGWCGDASKTYGGAKYAVNGIPDINADQMILKCSGISTDFSKIEVGEAVWCKGHIGVYIGDGLAVECTPSWKNCVQVTACNCSKNGYSRRNWTKHGKLPYVSYVGQTQSVVTAPETPTASVKPGAVPAKVQAAKHFDKSLSGAYKTTGNLNLRIGAGTDKTVLVVVPKGATVRNDGYYILVDGKKWLYVQYTTKGTTYTGYCSEAYLKK